MADMKGVIRKTREVAGPPLEVSRRGGRSRKASAARGRISTAQQYIDRGLRLAGDEAVEAFRRAIRFSPDWAEPYIHLTYALLSADRIDEAIASSSRACELAPDESEAHVVCGEAFVRDGRFKEAIAVARRALELDPGDDPSLHAARGCILMEAGEIDEGIAAFDRAAEVAVAFEPDELGSVYDQRAVALHKAGRFAEALDACERVLELDPDDQEAASFRENILENINSQKVGESKKPGYTGDAPPSGPADTSQHARMRDGFNIAVKQARTEALARLIDLDNPKLSDKERLTRARRLLRSFERRQAEDPDYPASPEVRAARKIVNRDKYQRFIKPKRAAAARSAKLAM